MERDLKQRIATAKEMQERLDKAREDLLYLEEFTAKFEAIQKNMKALGDYYFYGGPWMEDREIIEKEQPDLHLDVLGEDPIYDAFTSQYSLLKQILRETALYITE